MKLHPANPTPGNMNNQTPVHQPVTNKEIVDAMVAVMTAIQSVEANRLGGGAGNHYIKSAWDKVNDLRSRMQ